MRKVWSCQVPVGSEKGKINGPLLGIGPPFVNLGARPSGRHLDEHKGRRGASSQWSASILLGGALPLSGSCPLGWGKALATVTTSPIFQGCVFLFPLYFFLEEQIKLFFQEYVFWFFITAGYASR